MLFRQYWYVWQYGNTEKIEVLLEHGGDVVQNEDSEDDAHDHQQAPPAELVRCFRACAAVDSP